jgi:hydantoinase/carbamoylase family amidase
VTSPAAAVDAERMARDIEVIAACTESDPRIGHSRPTFSAEWRRARDYVLAEAEAAGCAARIDAAGNAHARPARMGWEKPAWLCGSHIDSVPTGGRFDGVVGVIVALEVLRATPGAPVELVVFAEEEGTTFNLGMLGSRAWAGTIGASELAALRNRHGDDYLKAGAAHGVRPELFNADHLSPAPYRGLIEAHVEQGPGLWNAGGHVALVTAIHGRRQYHCSLRGQANHAGSTRMADRRDALAGAAELILGLEGLARDLNRGVDHTVITVGRLGVEPNALNVIPGAVSLTIDFRSPSDDQLAVGDERIRSVAAETARHRGLELDITRTEDVPVVPMDPGVCALLRQAAARLGTPLPDAASGALHDTAILAPFLPAAMVFIASRDGISHNPAEYSRTEDIALAARIIAEAVTA